VLHLFEQDKLYFYDPVVKHLPDLAQTGDDEADSRKRDVEIVHLLTHTSGLIADNPIGDYEHGIDEARRRLLALKLKTWTGKNFLYSDVNYLVLGLLVERLSGQTLHEYSQQHTFRPLGMTDTAFIPNTGLKKRCAPTQRRDGQWMQGEVHDPRAYKMGGVAGHAGLFSTASDLSRYAAGMLNRGEYRDVRFLNDGSYTWMTNSYPVPARRNGGEEYEGYRGLGWDIRTSFSTSGGTGRSKKAFGHGGFTGTVIWIDPEQDWFFIFLSNRVHPDGNGLVNPLAGEIATIISAAAQTK